MSTDTSLSFSRCVRIVGALMLHAAVANAFDQNHRINNLIMQGGTDSFATNNALGGAFSPLGLENAQASLDASIADGSISVLFSFPGLVDLRGSNATSMSLGVASGSPVLLPDNPTTYNGASDLDWWYVFDGAGVDGGGGALQQLPASILGGVLNAGPGQLSFPDLFGENRNLDLYSAYLRATVGASSAPLRSTNNFPPGHRENLDPGLVSFATMTQGQMRGNVPAAVLAITPIPAALVGEGCNSGYAATNSLLDVIVGSCSVTVIIFVVPIVYATQPDQFDPNAPVLGAGPPYTFSRTGNSVTGARDRLGAVVNLQAALNASSYSTYFTFTTDRVIAFTEPSSPPRLTDITTQESGAVRFSFTNAPRASFSVLSATNVDLPLTNWSVLGAPTQTLPGVYQFADPLATNEARRFYRVRSP